MACGCNGKSESKGSIGSGMGPSAYSRSATSGDSVMPAPSKRSHVKANAKNESSARLTHVIRIGR